MATAERIYLSAPDVGESEARHLLDAVRSGWVAPVGPHLDAFEREVAARVGVAHAVGLSSGTAALHLGLLGLGVGPGQVVVVPTLTFVATANAVRYTGAEPVFVDCDPETGNLDPALLAKVLAECHNVGAVVPVDLLGVCADYTAIEQVCAAVGVPVLEDAAEALGATHAGRPAGSFGAAAVLSFNGNKIITTSSGGMLLSADGDLVARARYLATQARQPVAHYEHTETGYNYRLSNVLAALGQAQLARLDDMIGRRRLLRDHYEKTFGGIDGVRLLAADAGANAWLTAVLVEPERAGWSAADLGAYLGERNIETRPMWKPMHLQPLFRDARAAVTGAAERLFTTALVLPSGSALTDAEVGRVLDAVNAFLERR